MDLERDQSGLYSVRDSKAVVESVAAAVNINDVDSNGSCVNEGVGYLVDKGNQNGQPSCSPAMNAVSPSASGGSAPKKGYGLKKWKRITRKEVIANSSPCLDTGKVLKRGLSASTNPLSHFPQLTEEKQGTDNFGGPVTTLETNLGGINYFPAQASSSTAFDVGAVSENSEDRSSKSSTAARHRFGMPLVYPFSGDKNKPKNLSGKGLITSNQKKSQVGKGRSDPSKKLRGGERIKYEKENSHSSIESDSRSSNFVFMQSSNGRQSEASINYNEQSDEDIPGEPQFTDDHTAYSEANAREAEDISLYDSGADLSWEGTEENGGNHQSPARRDPLVDSILTLDSVSEALEKELQKFKELGKESYFTSADFACSVNPFDSLNGEDLAQKATDSVNLANKISVLESQMEEARYASRMKEFKVDDLEATLHSVSLYRGDIRNEAQAQEQEATKKLEEELEILFVQKLEADVKYLATANALQDAKYAPANPKTLLADQKAVPEEQLHPRNRLEQTECKVGKIKRQAKELESYSADFVETEQVLSVQRSINKLSWCSLALMLLAALWAMYFQMVSDSGVIVPT